MKNKIEKLLKENVTKETKQEKWALAAALALLARDLTPRGEVIDPGFYVQYGLDFAESLATTIMMEQDLKELELTQDDRKKVVKIKEKINE